MVRRNIKKDEQLSKEELDRFFHKDKRHGLVVRIADILVKIPLTYIPLSTT